MPPVPGTEWMFCNRCLLSITRGYEKHLSFHITNCGHIYCQDCVQPCIAPKCFVCKSDHPLASLIDSDMKIDMIMSCQSVCKLLNCLIQAAKLHRMQSMVHCASFSHQRQFFNCHLTRIKEQNRRMKEMSKSTTALKSEKAKIAAQNKEMETILSNFLKEKAAFEEEMRRDAEKTQNSTHGSDLNCTPTNILRPPSVTRITDWKSPYKNEGRRGLNTSSIASDSEIQFPSTSSITTLAEQRKLSSSNVMQNYMQGSNPFKTVRPSNSNIQRKRPGQVNESFLGKLSKQILFM